jgi:hypothetical protein
MTESEADGFVEETPVVQPLEVSGPVSGGVPVALQALSDEHDKLLAGEKVPLMESAPMMEALNALIHTVGALASNQAQEREMLFSRWEREDEQNAERDRQIAEMGKLLMQRKANLSPTEKKRLAAEGAKRLNEAVAGEINALGQKQMSVIQQFREMEKVPLICANPDLQRMVVSGVRVTLPLYEMVMVPRAVKEQYDWHMKSASYLKAQQDFWSKGNSYHNPDAAVANADNLGREHGFIAKQGAEAALMDFTVKREV